MAGALCSTVDYGSSLALSDAQTKQLQELRGAAVVKCSSGRADILLDSTPYCFLSSFSERLRGQSSSMHGCRIRCGVAQKSLISKVEKFVKGTVASTSTSSIVRWENALPLLPQCGTAQGTTDASALDAFESPAMQGTGCCQHSTKCLSRRSGGSLTANDGERERRSRSDVTGAADCEEVSGVSNVALLRSEDAAGPESPLTREQAIVCDLACQGASLFIGGDAGTGKSHLLRAIAERLRRRGCRIAVTASTGIAALNIGGNTFHSTFGVPLSTLENVMSLSTETVSTEATFDAEDVLDHGNGEDGVMEEEVSGEDFAAGGSVNKFGHPRRMRFTNTGVLANVDVVIIDEISMLHAGVLESFERAARRMRGRDARRPFGGLQMILSGDFLQLTPFSSLDAPCCRQRRYRPFNDDKLLIDDDRIICEYVSPENDAGKPQEQETRTPAETAEKSCPMAVDSMASEVEIAQAAKNGKRRRLLGAADCTARRCRRRDLWYYDKPMFESWCFIHHLLHVQLREPQRQQDETFVSDLNRLRQGRLPYRLSRSSLINAPVEDAVRLLPTKGAVRNYNDRKMLELEGEEQVFQTQLVMENAVCAPAVDAVTEEKTEEADEGSSCGATLLVHYRFCGSTGSSKAVVRRQGRLRDVETIAVARKLEEVCRFPPGSIQVYCLPSPLSYSTSLSAVCVRCSGETHGIAEYRRRTLKNLLEMWSGLPGASDGKATSGNVRGAQEHAQAITRLQSFGTLFPRELVRVEAVEARQLLRRLQPFMQADLRHAVRTDTVLQDKRLKVGCRVMLLRNLTLRYVNGSLGEVVAFRSFSACKDLLPGEMKARGTPPHFLARVAVHSTGHGQGGPASAAQIPVVRMDIDGKDVAIPWITLPVSVTKQDWCFTVHAACIPLTPAYAFTVHKVQGITLDHAVLFDAADMFPCDHLVYTAASRVRKFEHLRILNLCPRMISVHKPSLLFTQNISSVEVAAKIWADWKSMPRSRPLFYFPSHMDRGSPR
ncbi:helicase-like protein [Leishmania tarentolae]|uniref:ATP-dependent DNA helicase n=1 Tax=Leishmania tarentolae TaxID=5689 RepID=A0A640KVC9_LEITA|nr:helicase-like protein [Leishmania tarentolae]